MKTIIFLECNISGTGVRAIKIAQENGYRAVLFTKEYDFYHTIADNPLLHADLVVELNTDCIATIINAAIDYNPNGIVAFDDYRLINAAAASHALGLPSPNMKSLILCRYKNKTRQILFDPNDDFKYRVFDIKDKIDISEMKFPLVVKPCDDSGSSKVTICHSLEEVNIAVEEIIAFRTNQRGYKLSSSYLIEEFIDGNEYSAEAYWCAATSQWEILGFTKKYTTEGKYSVEIGHDFPYKFDSNSKIKKNIIDWLNKIGLSHTVAHVEFKLDKKSIMLIEINPRVAGGMIDKLCSISTGFDLVHCYLSLFVNDMEYRPKFIYKAQYASIRFLTSKRIGIIDKIIPKFILNKPLLFKFVPTPIKIKQLKDSYSRLGYVITIENSLIQAAAKADEMIKNIEIIYD